MAQIVRVEQGGAARYGRLEGEAVTLLSAAPWLSGTATGETVAKSSVRLLAPVEPTKVVCVGRNYAEHAKELGNELPTSPLIFLKPPSTVTGPFAPIVRPRSSNDVQHEAELGLVIGRRCRKVSEEDALSYVAGFTCVNDVTARDIQKRETQFTHAKGYDSFCPVGPHVVLGPPPADLAVRCLVNGAIRQDSRTRHMVFSPAKLVAFISSVMTLEPGDLIATGTPSGVSGMAAGDVVWVEVEGVGVLENPVVDDE